MFTEQAILELMDEYKDDNFAAAEAAYLAAQGMGPDEINRNLQLRYGDGQAYAQFKSELEEMTDHEIEDRHDVRFAVGDDTRKLENVTADDVGIAVDEVIRNAFLQTIEPSLREQVRETISAFDEEEQLLAGILRKGRDVELWGMEPNRNTVWEMYSIVADDVLSDRQQELRLDALVEAGCLYHQSIGFFLTPALAELENPYEHIADIEPVWP